MKCFYHPDVDAVGICKNCQKGICPACLVDTGNGIVCNSEKSANCEEQLKAIEALVGRNIAVSKRSGATYYFYSFMYAVLGISITILGFASKEYSLFISIVEILAGLAFIGGAIYSFALRSQILKKKA